MQEMTNHIGMALSDIFSQQKYFHLRPGHSFSVAMIVTQCDSTVPLISSVQVQPTYSVVEVYQPCQILNEPMHRTCQLNV